MTRGKYAVKAANRLVQTDSELLLEKVAECEALQAELDTVRLELQHVKTTINSQVLRESVRLAQADVEAARAETRAAQVADEELHLEVLHKFTDYVVHVLELWDKEMPEGHQGAIVPMGWAYDLFPRLVGQRATAEYIAKIAEVTGHGVPSRRAQRRATPQTVTVHNEVRGYTAAKRQDQLNEKFVEKLSGASDVEEA